MRRIPSFRYFTLKRRLHNVYCSRPETWNLDRAKAPGIVDLKSPHIVNMGRLKIDDPRELSRRSRSKFMTELGIHLRGSLKPAIPAGLQSPKPELVESDAIAEFSKNSTFESFKIPSRLTLNAPISGPEALSTPLREAPAGIAALKRDELRKSYKVEV